MAKSSQAETSSSILIIGSGVFGLSTAYALARRPEFTTANILMLERLDFPAPDAASIDSSRIIRPDYADAAYTSLMAEAHSHWRGNFGANGCYSESGLCIVTDHQCTDSEEAAGGMKFLHAALANVKARLGLKVGRREEGGQLEPLHGPADVRRIFASMGGECGMTGYVNWTSGWADAEAGMMHMRKLVAETGRVSFRTSEVRRLHFSPARVEKVELIDGEILTADLIILATGAWTPKLIDLRGVASATGQVLAYLELTQEEQERLGGNPTLICEDNGMFIIPPCNRILKVARHAYGYSNPTAIPHPERPDSDSPITVSLPRTKQDDPAMTIPSEGDQACREYLSKCIPDLAGRAWMQTRICWYCDTASGDWLIDYHPAYSNLFVATGGSGHAYKFLPIVGERIVDVILRQDRDDLGIELKRKWAWPAERRKEDHVWTDDWRGGIRGMVLDDEYNQKLGAVSL
ncbi:hypothetical protein M433DRAFT_139388 [Acidomyces richmondensis BFW]|nr:MAG: hypothetical protein FE78DRAFT_217940 [Acidomyces sp. 'richmondensis']KYG50167.1 hypothetical protein M433DRAFT_139388 [Acidomyces richmondensis BFW]